MLVLALFITRRRHVRAHKACHADSAKSMVFVGRKTDAAASRPREHAGTGCTQDFLHVCKDPWMLASQNRSDHGCHRGWAMDAPLSKRIRLWTIMFGPWRPSSQIGLDHGRHHGWAMDALFSGRIKEWTSSWLGHGGPLLRSD